MIRFVNNDIHNEALLEIFKKDPITMVVDAYNKGLEVYGLKVSSLSFNQHNAVRDTLYYQTTRLKSGHVVMEQTLQDMKAYLFQNTEYLDSAVENIASLW